MRPVPRPTWDRERIVRSRVSIAIAVVVLLLAWVGIKTLTRDHIPDFSDYENASEKKDAFFNYLAPYIAEVNAGILDQREHLLDIREDLDPGEQPGWFARRWIENALEEYEFDPVEEISDETLRQLAQRMDIIPPSLVMAQAANESAWGTSRFAQKGNNLFGMRTYEPGTGIVPKRRPAGQTWEVAAYHSIGDSIEAYIHNLNTHDPYLRLRAIRADMRKKGQPITGTALANGLRSYSELGYEYVSMIRSMIRSNDLERFDK